MKIESVYALFAKRLITWCVMIRFLATIFHRVNGNYQAVHWQSLAHSSALGRGVGGAGPAIAPSPGQRGPVSKHPPRGAVSHQRRIPGVQRLVELIHETQQ